VSLSRRSTTRWALLAVAPMALGACTMVGGVQPPQAPAPAPHAEAERPAPEPAPMLDADHEDQRPADRIAAGVVEVALKSMGTPYEWGGTDTNGFDCSGLIQFAYGRLGIPLPRVSAQQLRAGTHVDPIPELLRPGDILGFSERPAGKTSHVGLYVGEGEFIHSSSSGVRISTLRNPYWQEHFVVARRVVE